MNEECIGYHLVFLTNLKLLINRGNYIFFVTNGLAFQSFMCVRQLMAKYIRLCALKMTQREKYSPYHSKTIHFYKALSSGISKMALFL